LLSLFEISKFTIVSYNSDILSCKLILLLSDSLSYSFNSATVPSILAKAKFKSEIVYCYDLIKFILFCMSLWIYWLSCFKYM